MFSKRYFKLVYISRSEGLEKVADYWEQVLIINEHQRDRFSKKILDCIKKIIYQKEFYCLVGRLKKIQMIQENLQQYYVTNNLINWGIRIEIYDPKVKKIKLIEDLSIINENRDLSLVNVLEDRQQIFLITI